VEKGRGKKIASLAKGKCEEGEAAIAKQEHAYREQRRIAEKIVQTE